jgi:glyoxylase-like metal-dependent hydrolase (beta-lactamase superfamily II)
MNLYTINSGYFKLDGGAMHGVVPKSMWQKQNPADEHNMCNWAMRCLLIETGDRKILIDTGMGDKQDEKFFSHYYPHGEDSIEKNLAQYGFTPNDITDVFLTHLHFDHCGGAIKKQNEKLVPAFANATYWSNEKHWQTATQPNAREKASFLKENILPIQESGQLKMITQEGKWIDGIDIIFVNGHTEAMMLPLLHFNNKKLLFCADLLPSVAHISMPWVMAYDMQPLQTLNEKEKLLPLAAKENWGLFFEHDAKIECATVHEVEGRVRLKETCTLKEWMNK